MFLSYQDEILGAITAPDLKYLAVEIDDDDSNELPNFVGRSPNITTFRICSLQNYDFPAAVICRLNNVEVLIIGDEEHCAEFGNAAFFSLIPFGAFPKLSELRIELDDITHLMEPIRCFVKARDTPSPGMAAIRSVSSDCFHNHPTERTHDPFKKRLASCANLECWRFRDVLKELNSTLAL